MRVTSRGTEIMTHQQLVAYYYLHKKRSRLWRPILNLAAIGGPVQHQIVQGAAGGGAGVAAKAFALSPEPTAVAAAALPVRALSRSKRKPSSSDAMEPTSSLWCAMCRKDVPVELVLRCKALKCGNTICRYCFHGHRSDLRKRSKVTQLQTFEQCAGTHSGSAWTAAFHLRPRSASVLLLLLWRRRGVWLVPQRRCRCSNDSEHD